MISEQVREIVDVILVRNGNIPIAFGSSNVVEEYIKKAQEKNIKVVTKKITTNSNRANEIGFNIFKVNYNASSREELLKFRNNVITEWMTKCSNIKNCDRNIVWNRVAKSYGIPFDNVDQFSQSIIDKIDFLYGTK
jgi:type III secretion system FlhB-like substrate exporter